MRFPSKFIDVGTRVLHRLSWSAIDRLVAAVAVSAYENLLPVLLNRHTYISRYHHSTYALQKLDTSHRDILNLHETRVRAADKHVQLIWRTAERAGNCATGLLASRITATSTLLTNPSVC